MAKDKTEYTKCKKCGYKPVSLTDSLMHSINGCNKMDKDNIEIRTIWHHEAQILVDYVNEKGLAKDFIEWVKLKKEKKE